MRNITLLHTGDCPNWRTTGDRLAMLADELGLVVETRAVTSIGEAAATDFRGSPTILVDGVDPFGDATTPVGLACRLYATPDGLRGSPTVGMLRAALTA